MKKSMLVVFPIMFIAMTSCRQKTDYDKVINVIRDEIKSGSLVSAMQHADSLKLTNAENIDVFRKADSLSQIAERIGLDFSVPEDKVLSQIDRIMGTVSSEDKTLWEKKGWLECRHINGKKMYFNRAASNLSLIRKFHEQDNERLNEIASDPAKAFRLRHTDEVCKSSDNQSNPAVPITMKITYTIKVKPDVIPAGEIIRCWMPWPKESHSRQQNVKLLSTSNPEYIISPDSAIHSTIYMEGMSKTGIETVFQISYSYKSSGQYFKPALFKILPYDRTSALYRKYTSEQLPQICFTPNIKRLADSITDQEDSPDIIVNKIYYWFKANIPWAGALEYSIMSNIPEYVIRNRRGDCGMQTFLFMSLLRYKGVPVRWQSGWMVPPGEENLHDWCEVFYEGTGWVPVDISYDLQESDDKALRSFYISGIDSYRLIVNDGVAGPLHPDKNFLRSEPYDFQRGEVEWKGGNLYFNRWSYNMKIEYVK